MLRALFLANVLAAVPVLAQSTNYVAAAGYAFPEDTPAAPGQVMTLFVRGMNVPDAVSGTTPLPTTLSGVSVVVKNPPTPGYPTALPIFSIHSFPDACGGGLDEFCNTTAITVQFPYEPACTPNGFPNACTIGGRAPVKVAVTVNGVAGQEFWFSAFGGAPHFLNSCDSILGRGSGECVPLVTHADGSAVSLGAPARLGEVITIYVVGLGGTKNSKTGQAAAAPDPLPGNVTLTPAFRINTGVTSQFLVSNQAIEVDWAGLVQGFVGLYQINARVPGTLPSGTQPCPGGNLNLRLLWGLVPQDSVANSASVDLCVQP